MTSPFKQLVDNSIDAFEANTWTSIPAEVTTIGSTGDQTRISAQPVLNRLLRGSDSKALPPIHDVPVMWPATSTSMVRGVLSVGDWVLLVFSCRPLSNWLNSSGGDRTDPESFQKMNYNSAMALPGIFPFSKHVGTPANQSLPDTQADMVIKSNIGTSAENEVRLEAGGGILITATASGTVVNVAADGSITIDAATGMTLNGPLQVNGLIASTGTITGTTVTGTTDIVGGGKSLITHTHNYTDTNSGTGAGPGLGTVPTTAPL